MKPLIIRNDRYKKGDYERKLEYGKTYWFGWRGSSYSQVFVYKKGKTITLMDADGKSDIVTKRWLRTLLSKDEWCIQFLVEVEQDNDGKEDKIDV
jgi:hypothetical protein